MKKVSLIIRDKDQEAALEKLREVGVLHLERRNVSSDALSKALDRKARGEGAMALIAPYKVPSKKAAPTAPGARAAEQYGRRESDLVDPEREPYSLDALDAVGRPDLIDLLLSWGKDKKNLEDRLAFLNREQQRLRKWGNFDPRAVRDLAAAGVAVYPYEIAATAFANLSAGAAEFEGVRYILMGQDKNAVYLAVLDREIPGLAPLSLPEKSLAEIDKEAGELPSQIKAIEKRLASFANRMPALKRDLAEIQGNIEFESARSSLEKVEDVPGEYALSWITGYVPQDDVGLVRRASAENNWALMADNPGPDDAVPTKLKNGKLASLIRPLTDFLEVVPGYNEIDISGWFLFFFVIFFGMIFGDAGYGALILLICLFGMLKTAKKGVPPVLKLLLLLGLSNFAWGLLTCSWFGLKAAQVPDVLRNLSLPLISNVTADKSDLDKAMVQQNLMIFCFSLALLQLSIGHILAIIHDRSLRILGHLGSIAMLGGMYFIILALIASNEARQIPLFPAAVYVFGGGFALNFVFSSYEGSIGRSILESLKNIISVILGIANIFSDIMSYIRLWAVGLAGGAIADTVDTMAAQIGGIAGPVVVHFVVFILAMALLVFGHGLNLVLNTLSVLVHGVRLNTLEFSGHVGLTWAGTAYKPFAKRAVRSGE
jgi:V/A-type H+-transporting ATPase subunit I